jgi:hypothetical protein
MVNDAQEILEFMREDFATKYKMMKGEADRRKEDRSQYRYSGIGRCTALCTHS